jgi:dienelactone hydrolase
MLALRCVPAWFVAGLLAIGLVFGLSSGSANAARGSFREDEVRFNSAGVTLEGTVLVPDGERRKPAMALVHGAGSGPRDSYRREAEAFARGGIITFIYDKRTEGYSGFDRSFDLLAGDAVAAVHALQDLPYVDPEAVGLWGLSEGAWVVPLAAARSDEVAFVVLVAATGVPPAQQHSWNLENELRRQGVSGSMVKAVARTSVRLIVDAGLFAEANHDPVEPLEHVRQPVLALWGEKDRIEPPAESARILQEALERGGNLRYTIRFFPDAEHELHTSPDGFKQLDDFAPGYVDTVTSWVNEVARGEAPGPSIAGPVPEQNRLSRPLAPLAWWESGWVQLGAFALPVLAFTAYLAAAFGAMLPRRVLEPSFGAPQPTTRWVRRWARWLAGAGLVAMLCFVVYIGFLMFTTASAVGPVVVGRPLPWLALQIFALTIGAAILGLTVSWWSIRQMVSGAEQAQLGIVLTGGVVFVAWATYWGILVP